MLRYVVTLAAYERAVTCLMLMRARCDEATDDAIAALHDY